MVEWKYRGHLENQTSGVSEENPNEEYDMQEINDAFNGDVNTGHQQIDTFGSYDEDYVGVDENESEFSFDSGTNSDLEFGDVGNLPNENISEFDGNLDSLKAAFEAVSQQGNDTRVITKSVLFQVAARNMSEYGQKEEGHLLL